MINKENLKKVLDFLEFTHRKEIYTYKNTILGYTIVVALCGKRENNISRWRNSK